jgi:hypothetical protein
MMVPIKVKHWMGKASTEQLVINLIYTIPSPIDSRPTLVYIKAHTQYSLR